MTVMKGMIGLHWPEVVKLHIGNSRKKQQIAQLKVVSNISVFVPMQSITTRNDMRWITYSVRNVTSRFLCTFSLISTNIIAEFIPMLRCQKMMKNQLINPKWNHHKLKMYEFVEIIQNNRISQSVHKNNNWAHLFRLIPMYWMRATVMRVIWLN